MAKQILARKHSHKKRCNKWQTLAHKHSHKKILTENVFFFKFAYVKKCTIKKTCP